MNDDTSYLVQNKVPKLVDDMIASLVKHRPMNVHKFWAQWLENELWESENPQWTSYVNTAIKQMPQGLDLTDASADQKLEDNASLLLDMFSNINDLRKAEQSLRPRQDCVPITVLLAVKMALSKKVLEDLHQKVHVSWVVAVYGEQNRILSKEKHENGEDFVRRKIRQLRWLQKNEKQNENFTWDLVFVDDGCPNKSGKLIEEIVTSESLQNVKVLWLQDAIDKKLPIIHGLENTKDSRKGGSVHYGMWWAANNCKPSDPQIKHVVGFTDADLSSNLSQSGLLVAPIVTDGAVLALATRYEDGGIECSSEKAELLEVAVDNPAGIAFRHFIRKNIMPPLSHIFDTQCGFKALDAEKINEILPKVTDKLASFDMELLVVTGLLFPKGKTGNKSLFRCPIVWVASAAESNFWQSASSEYETHYKMNGSMIALSKKQTPLFSQEQIAHRAPYLEFFESLSIAQFEHMCEGIKGKVGKNFDRFEMHFDISELRLMSGI